MMQFDELFQRVEITWPFNARTYPNLPLTSEAQSKVATTGHVLLHIVKQAGKLAAIVEPLAHPANYRLDHCRQEIAQQVAYMIVNVVRLAQLADVSEAEVEAEIEAYLIRSARVRSSEAEADAEAELQAYRVEQAYRPESTKS